MTIKKQNPLVGKFFVQRPGYVQFVDSEISTGLFLIRTLSIKRVEEDTQNAGTMRAARDFAGLPLFNTYEAAVASQPDLEHADAKAIREFREDDAIIAKLDPKAVR